MSISPEAFNNWLKQASGDDIDYALEIIKKHKEELIIHVSALDDYEIDDLSEAKEVINKIKGKK